MSIFKCSLELIEKLSVIDAETLSKYVPVLVNYVEINKEKLSKIQGHIYYILEIFKNVYWINDHQKFNWGDVFRVWNYVLGIENLLKDNLDRVIEGLTAYMRSREKGPVRSTEENYFNIITNTFKKNNWNNNSKVMELSKLAIEKMPDSTFFQ